MGISWICQPSKCFLWLCSSVEVSQSYSIRHSWDSLDFTQDDPDKIVYIVWLHRRKASTESRTQWKANEFNSRLMRPFSFPTNFEASLWTSILFGDSVISRVREDDILIYLTCKQSPKYNNVNFLVLHVHFLVLQMYHDCVKMLTLVRTE